MHVAQYFLEILKAAFSHYKIYHHIHMICFHQFKLPCVTCSVTCNYNRVNPAVRASLPSSRCVTRSCSYPREAVCDSPEQPCKYAKKQK